MSLTDLLQFAAPDSFKRVKRFDDGKNDLWLLGTENQLQSTLDNCVTWRGVPVPASEIWPQIGAFNAAETLKNSPAQIEARKLAARHVIVDEYLDNNEAVSALILSVMEGATTKEEARTMAKAKIV